MRRMPSYLFAFGFLFITFGFPLQMQATDTLAPMNCHHAIEEISQQTFVPRDVLFAISITETGRSQNGQFGPWPWAMNAGGRGQYFGSQAALLSAAQSILDSGKTSFDVGCFQLNYRWHGAEFNSLHDMTLPVENTRYAAKFLERLFTEFGSWDKAIGAYHSRTKKHADRYRRAVAKNRNRVREVAQTKPSIKAAPDKKSVVHKPKKVTSGSLFSNPTAGRPLPIKTRKSLFQ